MHLPTHDRFDDLPTGARHLLGLLILGLGVYLLVTGATTLAAAVHHQAWGWAAGVAVLFGWLCWQCLRWGRRVFEGPEAESPPEVTARERFLSGLPPAERTAVEAELARLGSRPGRVPPWAWLLAAGALTAFAAWGYAVLGFHHLVAFGSFAVGCLVSAYRSRQARRQLPPSPPPRRVPAP